VGGGGEGVPNPGGLLDSLNSDPLLDATTSLNNLIHDDEVIGQFFSKQVDSKYFDLNSFRDTFSKSKLPIILSLNIQSLQSKHADLKLFMSDLLSSEICIDLIIMQEIWSIKFPELLQLPGFQNLVFKARQGMRGGGLAYMFVMVLILKFVVIFLPSQQKHSKTLF